MKKASPPSLYAHTHNSLLSYLSRELKVGERLPSQADLSDICEVSVTTIHRILRTLKKGDLFCGNGEGLELRRIPKKKDYLPEPQALSRRDEVEQSLVEMVINGKFKAGQSFSELSLAREHDVTTGTIREVLLSLTRLGIFTKQARKQWRMIEVDDKIVNELMDLRILMESFALRRFFSLPRNPAVAGEFRRIYHETLRASRRKNADAEDFVRLDRELHQTILTGADNRYLKEYSQYISFPIQFQFLRHAFNEKLINFGTADHLRILRAINAQEAKKAVERLEEHLEHARETLLGLALRAPAGKPEKGVQSNGSR